MKKAFAPSPMSELLLFFADLYGVSVAAAQAELEKLTIERLTPQMGSYDGEPDMHRPDTFGSAEIAQLPVFGFAKKSRASRRVSKMG